MLAIRKKSPVVDRKVTIEIPENFGDQVEIIILSNIDEMKIERLSKEEIGNIDKSIRTEALKISESSLKKDWNKFEEDIAWQNL